MIPTTTITVADQATRLVATMSIDAMDIDLFHAAAQQVAAWPPEGRTHDTAESLARTVLEDVSRYHADDYSSAMVEAAVEALRRLVA